MRKIWHAKTVEEVASELQVDSKAGLSGKEFEERLAQYGENKLAEGKTKSMLQRFFEQLKDFMVIVLIVASAISLALGEWEEAVIIVAIVLLNALLGVVQESKAEKSLEAIKKMSSPNAKVIRDGVQRIVSVEQVVPGDIVVIDTGDYMPADIRIVESHNLKVEESSLTGESVPVEKITHKLDDEGLGIGDRTNMAFMGSVITYGRGTGIVVETAMNTEIGKIADMINNAESTQTPLQRKLEQLGKTLAIVALAICAVIFAIGLLEAGEINGEVILELFMTAVSLAVAAIPEGLPAIVTIVLALGMQKMVKRNAIMRKLPAVETLGSASVICSDKTGTLTQNKMTVKRVYTDGSITNVDNINNSDNTIKMLIDYGVLCNDTKVNKEDDGTFTKIGDPTEIALVDLAIEVKYNPIDIINDFDRKAEIPFDSERKLMTTVNNIKGKYVSITKGAPDILVGKCNKIYANGSVRDINDKDIENINKSNAEMANSALRVLAVGYKELDKVPNKPTSNELESDLIFLGLYGMIDPPREEAKDAIRVAKNAGIKTVMITGDHKNTAIAIAKDLGIIQNESEAMTGAELAKISDEELAKNIKNYSVYARVAPEHKVKIVKAWQANGNVVAMTGDGVNDAPALKTADIGVAMGITGTEVSKGASDMILTDDNFATIVSAVEEGRSIFANIKKATHFLLSCNIGEIVTILLAVVLGPFIFASAADYMPLSATQILWVNLVTDSLLAIALGLEPAEPDVMDRKPRDPKASIFSDGLGLRITYQGIYVGIATFVAYYIGLQINHEVGSTMAFMTLAFTQLFHAFDARSDRNSIFKVGLFRNKYMWGAFIVSGVIQLCTLFPGVRDLFGIVMLNTNQWVTVLGLAFSIVIVVEIEKAITNSMRKN